MDPLILQFGLVYFIYTRKMTCEPLANSADPDQTALWEQSDEGLHCLLRHFVWLFTVNKVIFVSLIKGK